MSSSELVTSAAVMAGVTIGLLCWPTDEANPRLNVVDVSRPGAPARVVRSRSPGKRFAVFSAFAQAIEPGHFVRFEASSENAERSVPRWSCVAFRDVQECFGEPLRIRYLEGDERMVLSVTAGFAGALERQPEPDGDPAVAAR